MAFIGLVFFGCSEDDRPNCSIDQIEGNPKSILGTWQLSKVIEFDFSNGERHPIDYSCNSVKVTFFPDGEFLVEGGVNGISWIDEDTKFSFDYGEVQGMYGNSVLKLGDKLLPCFIDKSEMIWDEAWVDGGSYEFYRIQDLEDK